MSMAAINIYALLPLFIGLVLGILAITMDWGWFRRSLFLIIGGAILLIGGFLTIVQVPVGVTHIAAYNTTLTTPAYSFNIANVPACTSTLCSNVIETYSYPAINTTTKHPAYNVTEYQPILNEPWGFAYQMTFWLISLLWFALATIYVLTNTKSKRL